MPEATLNALARHQNIGSILSPDGGDCEHVLALFANVGIDINALARRLQDEGARSFAASWGSLMNVIASKTAVLTRSA